MKGQDKKKRNYIAIKHADLNKEGFKRNIKGIYELMQNLKKRTGKRC